MELEMLEAILSKDVLRTFDPSDFQHVLWLGGSPCSGKSSITDMLAEQFPVQVYHVDEAFQQHSPEFTPNQYPMNYRWLNTSWQELWMQSQKSLLEQAIVAYTEHLQFILSDLSKTDGVIIAEGTSLLPDYICRVSDPSHMLWIVPTEAFQREMYPKRGPFVAQILQQCAEPKQALQNWMDRDVAFARWIMERTTYHNLRCIQVDGQRSIKDNATWVAEYFQLA